MTDMTPADLNRCSEGEARRVLKECCGCERWASCVASARPFESIDAVRNAAIRCWQNATEVEVLEAIGHHPRIGERQAGSQTSREKAWSGREQSGMAVATDMERDLFAALNREYERTFGFVFLIRAAGRTPTEMLDQLRRRLKNDRHAEIANARLQQGEIMLIRLGRLLSE